MRWHRFLGALALLLAVCSLSAAQSPEDLAAPEGPPATVDGLVDLDALEWVIVGCANRWTPTGSLSLCAVHDCEVLYLMLTSSYYDIEREPMFVVFDLDRDGRAFAPGDLALTSGDGLVTFSEQGTAVAQTETHGVSTLQTQPQTGELQLEASIPLAELDLAPGGSIPYTFGQSAIPPADVSLAVLSIDLCGGPTPEFATPRPWPTEFTNEMFLEQLRAEQEALEAQQRAQTLMAVGLGAVVVSLLGVVTALLWRRQRRV